VIVLPAPRTASPITATARYGRPPRGDERQPPERQTRRHRRDQALSSDEGRRHDAAEDAADAEHRGEPADAGTSEVEQAERYDHDQHR
jgi:hypothetical protein